MIRAWQAGDIPRLAALERLCFAEPWSERALADGLENPYFTVFVWEEEGKILGYAGYQRALDEAQIANVATHPEARRAGIARALLTSLAERWREEGICTATLEVRPSNGPAKALYASLGFFCEGRRPHFYSDGEDAELYRWNL